jgi:hypothetical protein
MRLHVQTISLKLPFLKLKLAGDYLNLRNPQPKIENLSWCLTPGQRRIEHSQTLTEVGHLNQQTVSQRRLKTGRFQLRCLHCTIVLAVKTSRVTPAKVAKRQAALGMAGIVDVKGVGSERCQERFGEIGF